MKYLIAIALFFVATLATADEVTVRAYEPPALNYPAKCYRMADAEFYRWAIEFNRKAEKSVVYSGQPKWLLDYYRRSTVYQPWGIYGGLYSASGMVQTRYLNPDYVSPTPLHILNPFCKPEMPKRQPR